MKKTVFYLVLFTIFLVQSVSAHEFVATIIKINDGDTPLFMAAYGNKNPEVIKALLEYGADVNIRDDSGKTALEYTYKNYRVRKILLHYKEQINRIDKRKIIK